MIPHPRPYKPTPLATTLWLLKAAEVARRLSLGRSEVFQMLAAGKLLAVWIGRSVRVPEKALP